MHSSTRHAPDGLPPPDWSLPGGSMRRRRDVEQAERRHTLVAACHSGAPRSGEPGIHNHDWF